MSNIKQFFRVSLLLAESEATDLEGFADKFFGSAIFVKGDWVLDREDTRWVYCTWSRHLTCLQELDTIEDAETMEQEAFDILSEYGYFKPEEEEE